MDFNNIDVKKIKEEAYAYNDKIFKEKDSIYNPNLVEGYDKNLNPFNDGMMGYLSIEKIGVNLPIYHGVSEGVLQKGIGHLKGTSLPIGGKSTHAVLSSHSGLPNAKLLTDLHKLKKDDEFVISVLGEDHYYKVNQIKVVLPKEVEDLKPVENKDYVTLFTCTPYGINTHRLLVRGERVYKNTKDNNNSKEEVKKNVILTILKLVIILFIIIFIIFTIIRDISYLIKKSLNN